MVRARVAHAELEQTPPVEASRNGGMLNSKIQAPISREAPGIKHQCAVVRRRTFWSLNIEVSLEFGAWNLELFLPGRHAVP
jgi:hypothetical protein